VPSLSRRGVVALALEQLSFELDEEKFQALANAHTALRPTSPAAAAAAAAAPGNLGRAGGAGDGMVVRSAAQLAALFVELLLGEEKFFSPAQIE
jgi:hypothetical protein